MLTRAASRAHHPRTRQSAAPPLASRPESPPRTGQPDRKARSLRPARPKKLPAASTKSLAKCIAKPRVKKVEVDEMAKGFTVEARQHLLDHGLDLPPCVREPPERSASIYILERMHDLPALRRFLDDLRNWRLLMDLKAEFIEQVVCQKVPTHQQKAIMRRVDHVLCGTREAFYSVENCVKRMKQVLQMPGGFERLCAREYLLEEEPGPFWQLRVLLLLILLIDDRNQPGILCPRDLDSRTCAICLESVREVGTRPWLQLEPCRHFLCASCGEEQLRRDGAMGRWSDGAMGKCPLCRRGIVGAGYSMAHFSLLL